MKSLLKFCALLMTGALVGCTKTDEKEPEPKEPATASIRGAVFIATKSGNAVKLPLVRVCAVPADTYNKQLSQHSDSFLSGFRNLLKEHEEELEELKDFSEKNLDAFEMLTEASQIWGELQALKKNIGEGIALFTASRKISIRKHESVTEGQELLSALNSRIEKLNQLRGDHRETWERFADWWRTLDLSIAVTGDQTTDKGSSKRDHREAVFGALLKKQFKIESRSDADGKFSMNLDPNLDYVLVATAKRLVGEETEKYYWAWLAKGSELSPDREIFLSNSELISRSFNLLDLNPEDPDRRGKLAIRIGAALEELEGLKKFKIQYSGGGLLPVTDSLAWALREPLELYNSSNDFPARKAPSPPPEPEPIVEEKKERKPVYRTWTSKDGRKLEAWLKLVSKQTTTEDDELLGIFQKRDGSTHEIPISRLSKSDMDLIMKNLDEFSSE